MRAVLRFDIVTSLLVQLFCVRSDFKSDLKCISSMFAAEEACFFRCHNKCYNTPDCNWYTSYGEGAICNLYANCDSIGSFHL